MTDKEIEDMRSDFDMLAKRISLVAATHKLLVTIIRFKIGNCEEIMNRGIHDSITRQGF
jgi:hypothetical protein